MQLEYLRRALIDVVHRAVERLDRLLPLGIGVRIELERLEAVERLEAHLASRRLVLVLAILLDRLD